jgi:uncharacterized protein
MKIIIAGGRGFLGSTLTSLLLEKRHDVVVLTRGHSPTASRPHLTFAPWTPDGRVGAWASLLKGAGAVVNLAGESIGARRWSASQKQKLRQSRLLATCSLTAAIREMPTPRPVLVSASAVGFYGDRGDEPITEASPPGSDFLASLCQEWEGAACDVAPITRVALVRTGIVLDRHEGALAKMLLPFRLCVGGPFGSGRQYMPWIHKTDWARMVAWIIENQAASGPINATGPTPVTNAEFSRALGRALKRPSFMPAPGFALRLALGEMADALLLGGQRVLPARATDLGFRFRFNNIDAGLADVLK